MLCQSLAFLWHLCPLCHPCQHLTCRGSMVFPLHHKHSHPPAKLQVLCLSPCPDELTNTGSQPCDTEIQMFALTLVAHFRPTPALPGFVSRTSQGALASLTALLASPETPLQYIVLEEELAPTPPAPPSSAWSQASQKLTGLFESRFWSGQSVIQECAPKLLVMPLLSPRPRFWPCMQLNWSCLPHRARVVKKFVWKFQASEPDTSFCPHATSGRNDWCGHLDVQAVHIH